jgi:hypothetical protein
MPRDFIAENVTEKAIQVPRARLPHHLDGSSHS